MNEFLYEFIERESFNVYIIHCNSSETMVAYFCPLNESYFLSNTLLYTRLFSPRVMFAHLHLQTVWAHLQFAQTHLCLKIDNLRHWNLHSLKFAH